MVFYDLGSCYYWPKGYIEGNTGSYSKGGSSSTSFYLSGTTDYTSKKVYVYLENERKADPCTLCQRVSDGNLLRCMKKQ